MDPNRGIESGAQGDPYAEEVYRNYHSFLEQASETVGRGILLDIHGQVRPNGDHLGAF